MVTCNWGLVIVGHLELGSSNFYFIGHMEPMCLVCMSRSISFGHFVSHLLLPSQNFKEVLQIDDVILGVAGFYPSVARHWNPSNVVVNHVSVTYCKYCSYVDQGWVYVGSCEIDSCHRTVRPLETCSHEKLVHRISETFAVPDCVPR